MTASQLLAEHVAKGCNEACARAVAGLARVIVRVLWGYLHYWTLAIVIPLGIAVAWLRSGGDG